MCSRAVAVAVAVACLLAVTSVAQEKPDGGFVEMTADQAEKIRTGLDFLSRTQNADGSWGHRAGAPVATTAIAGLAFLAGGHVPGRSRYGENARRAILFLLQRQSKGASGGYINEGVARGMGGSGMHGHGYAVLFLAEAYGMTGSIQGIDTETLKGAVTAGVRLIENSQCDNGGWNYEPSPTFDEGSVTVTQVQALRAARNAGILVDARTVEKAVDYIRKSTDANGQTRYSLTSGGHSSFALTAAGMSVLNFLGRYSDDKVRKGCDSLLRQLPGAGGNNANMGAWGGWYFYGNYYATLALYQRGGRAWEKWFAAMREDLLRSQASDGAWRTAESLQYGDAFGTGVALQILQIPYRYLPIYQRAND